MLRRMRILTALVLLMLLGGCADQSEDEGPVQVDSFARSCEPLTGAAARQAVRQKGEFRLSRIAYATQVPSIDVKNFNIVSVEFAAKGRPHQTGVWAIGVGSTKGVGFALNEVARHASSWPTSSADPDKAQLFTAHSIYDAERCSDG